MNIKEAITTHTQWRFAVSTLIMGKPQPRMDASVVASDSECHLGRWLHGAGRIHKDNPLFADLVKTHARFHRTAASLVSDFYPGRPMDVSYVGSGSELARLSARVTMLLTELGSVLIEV